MSLFKPIVIAFFTLGSAIGIGSYTFVHARGASYLSNNPEACANCHVMREHYAAWMKSSHRDVATCNDCHTTPGHFVKWADKAGNGFRHSLAFTTGEITDPLRATPGNASVTEKACRNCHAEMVAAMEARAHSVETVRKAENVLCGCCHTTVGHWVY
jgi:cytochrome c nitrite reductase small subunit